MEKIKTIFPKEKFLIGQPYQRKDMDEMIGEIKINNRSGSGVFSFENTVVLLVTLEQDLSEEENSYEDFLNILSLYGQVKRKDHIASQLRPL